MGLEDRLNPDMVVDTKPIRQEFIIPLSVRKTIGGIFEYALYIILVAIFGLRTFWFRGFRTPESVPISGLRLPRFVCRL